MQKFFKYYWINRPKVMSTEDMKLFIGKISEKYQGNSQNDSHELLQLMLKKINDDLNRVTPHKSEINDIKGESLIDCANRWTKQSREIEDSIITDIFEGQ